MVRGRAGLSSAEGVKGGCVAYKEWGGIVVVDLPAFVRRCYEGDKTEVVIYLVG